MFSGQDEFQEWLNADPSRKQNLPHWEEFFKFDFKTNYYDYLQKWEQDYGKMFAYLEVYSEWLSTKSQKQRNEMGEGLMSSSSTHRLTLIHSSKIIYQQVQEIKKLEQEKKDLERQLREQENTLTNYRQRLDQLKTQLSQKDQQIKDLEQKVQQLKIKEKECKELQGQCKQEKKNSAFYQTQIETLNKEVANKEEKITEWIKKIEEYEDKILDCQNQLSSLKQREKSVPTTNQTENNWWVNKWKEYKHHCWWLIPLVILLIVGLYFYKKLRIFND